MKIIFNNDYKLDIDSIVYNNSNRKGVNEYDEDILILGNNNVVPTTDILALSSEDLSKIKIVTDTNNIVYKGFTNIIDISTNISNTNIATTIIIGHKDTKITVVNE